MESTVLGETEARSRGESSVEEMYRRIQGMGKREPEVRGREKRFPTESI